LSAAPSPGSAPQASRRPAGPLLAAPPSAAGLSGEAAAPARWRDPKRHAWLLGLVVPTLPFIAWGLVEATGLGVLWFFGPVLVFGIFPLLDLLIGMDARNPPDDVIKWLE
jgi:alkane 1-monooxygenase